MPRKNDAWGIEVGANAIKALRLTRAGSDVVVKDFEILPFKQILTTPDLNVDELIQVGLDSLLSKHDIAHSQVVVSVPGHMGFARFAKLPPVEPKKIPDIVRFEAVQQIPFPIEQVEWDYQVFQQADSPDVEVGIFAITKERVLQYLTNFRQVNLRVDALTQSPLAVYNAFSYDRVDEKDDGVIYMDIGTRSTDVIIAEQGQILPRTLPIGGNHFTEALVKAFKLSFPKAEKLKREAGTSKYARQIFQAMRPVFADLVQELQRSLGYYQSINRDANLTKLVGVGSTFRLPGLQKFLKQQLQIEVIRPDGYQRIAAEGKREAEFAEHAINMATAYGLALQGLGLESVSANLLPQHILTQRMWRAKQPWFAATAACVALAAGAMTVNHYSTAGPYESVRSETDNAIRPVVSKAQSNWSEWSRVANGADPRDQIENLRSILDYRAFWPKLLQDISLAAAAADPQPETVAADYEQISQIPRHQRRRIYIDTLDVRYVVGGTASEEDSGADPRRTGRGGSSRSSGGGSSVSGNSPDDFFNGNARRPRFEITVRGTTPHEDGAGFINRHFLAWLRDHGNQPDRPYRMVIDMNTAIESIQKVGTRGGGSSSGQQTNWRDAGSDPMRSMDAPDPRSGRGMDTSDPRSGRGTTSGRDRNQVQELLPRRPLTDEPQAEDWQFELRWEVELRSPEEIREAEPPAQPERREAREPAEAMPASEGEGASIASEEAQS